MAINKTLIVRPGEHPEGELDEMFNLPCQLQNLHYFFGGDGAVFAEADVAFTQLFGGRPALFRGQLFIA